ncbi:MAG TPA: FAD-binding oxidoreductase [Candidatus Dormibacteraeota bacterium]|nr:FAD-binding oxidoreductase [Candidatus Dormibacteraeota bacterium]
MSSRGPLKAPVAEKPSTAEELAKRLHEAADSKSAVVPVGGGRASGMGGAPARCDLELHTTRLDRVLEHSQADMVVSVEAGITLEAVQGELAKAGQFLPLDPFNSPGHTIGGLLATGWSGPLRLRFGSARDFLIGIRVALPDGRLVSAGGRVVKNVSGYDMMKLHFGAMGSLGIIVAASFKVFPQPLHDVTVSAIHPSIEDAWQAAERALAMPLAPAALELFPDGRVLARFFGSRDAVNRMVAELRWKQADASVWVEHSRRGLESWARISVPRHALRDILDTLPPDASWWASPGIGIAHWSFGSELESVRKVRAAAERAQGSLVVMAAPADVAHQLGAWGTLPATIEVMRTLKHAFDPDGVLNPGRFVV